MDNLKEQEKKMIALALFSECMRSPEESFDTVIAASSQICDKIGAIQYFDLYAAQYLAYKKNLNDATKSLSTKSGRKNDRCN